MRGRLSAAFIEVGSTPGPRGLQAASAHPGLARRFACGSGSADATPL